MANESITLLQDVIEEVAGKMSLPTTPIYAKGEKGYNEALNLQADKESPFIMYALEQNGSDAIENNGKAYLSYQTTLLFLDFTNNIADEIQQCFRQMHRIRVEFLQRLIRTDAYSNVPENQALAVTWQERALLFDSHVSGIQVQFTIKIDPNIITPAC